MELECNIIPIVICGLGKSKHNYGYYGSISEVKPTINFQAKLLFSFVFQAVSCFISINMSGGARGVMLSSKEMDTATRVQILDQTDYISHSTNTFGKSMNPIILPPAMGK